jgi:hypothetical protein
MLRGTGCARCTSEAKRWHRFAPHDGKHAALLSATVEHRSNDH